MKRIYLYFLAVNKQPGGDNTLNQPGHHSWLDEDARGDGGRRRVRRTDRSLSWSTVCLEGTRRLISVESDVTKYTEVTQSSSTFGDVPSLYGYGFMKISSEEDHHQDTLWIVTTTANSRENSTFNSETPREGRASKWSVNQNRNPERLVTEVVRAEASI